MHSPLKPHFTTRLRRRRCFPVHIIAPRVQIKKIHIICTAQRRLMLYIYSDVWLFNVLQHNKTALVKRLSCCVVREEYVCLCFYAHSHYKAIKLSRWTAENFILCSSALSTSDPMGWYSFSLWHSINITCSESHERLFISLLHKTEYELRRGMDQRDVYCRKRDSLHLYICIYGKPWVADWARSGGGQRINIM